MNLKKYLERIHFKETPEASLSILKKLQKAHLLHIPFENLDIHFKRPIELNREKIYDKIVEENRGGFCYELNGLFYELLQSIGFQVKMISGRVYEKDKGFGQEFDHLALIVTIEDTEYLTDVGFGEFCFTPLKLELNTIQKDERGDFIIEKYDDHYFQVSKSLKGDLTPEYIFTRQERALDEYAPMCQYHQTSPESHFTKKRLCTLPTEKGRITISGNTVKITDEKGAHESIIHDEKEFFDSLWRYFKVKISYINY